MHSSISNGASNYLFICKQTNTLPGYCKEIIFPVLQRNAYWAHHENILLEALFDSDKVMKEWAIKEILHSRDISAQSDSTSHSSKKCRKFLVPPVNFNSSNITELINWKETHVTPPPFVSNWNNESIRQMAEESYILKDYPCTTQPTERIIRIVSGASLHVFGHEERHGVFINSITSRVSLKKLKNPKIFKNLYLLCIYISYYLLPLIKCIYKFEFRCAINFRNEIQFKSDMAYLQ